VAANTSSPHRAPPVSVGCGPDVWGRSVPQFEGRQLGRLDAERRELLALII
jgi:hypothetical protein